MKSKNIENIVVQSQSQQKKKVEQETEIIQLIVFNLGNEEYGANINQVREIVRTGIITPIPDSPDFIRGISNIRGDVPVIIDLKSRFSLPAAKGEVKDRHIVIAEQDKNIFGLLVEKYFAANNFSGIWHDPHDCLRRDTFAAATLANHAKGLSLHNVEADIIHCLHRTFIHKKIHFKVIEYTEILIRCN